ncbi:MAG TPA: LytTR family DNA-binding domain-containing protein [Reyranella sp.]|nr:LytTR family DNA-binding domain-containing protein [Reyranella sp.]
MRESPYFRSLPWHLPPIVLLAVVMAVTGPFGTYLSLGLGARLVYFGVIGGLSWLQVILLAAWLGRLEPIDRWPVYARMALVGLLAAIPSTAEVIVVQSWLDRPIPWRAYPSIYPDNAFLTVVISVVLGLFVEQRLRAKADAERARVAELPQAGPDFFRRIPPALGRDLLALEMEDHYLRIHTAVGSDLILLRLRDALAELGPSRGRQVHRSWWVADGAVTTTERRGARPLLVLRNGLKVPVSKSFREPAKEMGWL